MDSIEKAAALIKGIANKTQGAMHSANVTTLTGIAKSDSADGIVKVDLGGATIGEDDAEQAIEIETTTNVKAGDVVQVQVSGADGTAKNILATGVVGGGDRTNEKIEKIKAIVRETDEGIEISKPDSEFTTVTTNNSYLIKQNGKVVTEISNSEQIYYHEVDGENRPYGKISVEQDGEFRNLNIMVFGKKFMPAIQMGCSNTKSMISIMADANNPKVGSFGIYMSQYGNNGNPTSFLLYNNYNLINYLYPIGSYYMSDDPTSPAKLFGLIWEKLAEGTVLMSAGDTYTAGQVYGENEHTLTVDEMPAHTHGFYIGYGNTTSGPHDALFYSKMQVQPWGGNGQYLQQPAGGSQPHNNMQKSYATNIWRRIG